MNQVRDEFYKIIKLIPLIDDVKFLVAKELNKYYFNKINILESINLCQMYIRHKLISPIHALNQCCASGHLCIVIYLKAINTPINEQAISNAAMHGYLLVVKYLHSINAPIDDKAMTYAASFGHLAVVKYLHSINAPINGLAIAHAAAHEHLDVVNYLISINAPINKLALICAPTLHIENIIEDYLTNR